MKMGQTVVHWICPTGLKATHRILPPLPRLSLPFRAFGLPAPSPTTIRGNPRTRSASFDACSPPVIPPPLVVLPVPSSSFAGAAPYTSPRSCLVDDPACAALRSPRASDAHAPWSNCSSLTSSRPTRPARPSLAYPADIEDPPRAASPPRP